MTEAIQRHAPKLGAIFYALWGAMHIGIALALYGKLSDGGAPYAGFIGSALSPETFQHPYDAVTLGLFRQHAWNLGLFGAFAIAVAPLNWANHRLGYGLNLGVVSAADIGFIVAILGRGYIRLAEGIGGPVLWLLAALFSTVGRLHAHRDGRVA
jgi:hypothetical protein